MGLVVRGRCMSSPRSFECSWDRTVGIWEAPSESFLEKLEEGLKFNLPREHGYDVVQSIHAMENSMVDVLICMGGNFLSATPDTPRTSRAIQNVGLTVQISTKLNRSHLVTGDTALILPVLGRTELDVQSSGEQFVTVENSMGVVHRSKGNLRPASNHLVSEPALVAHLGQLLCPEVLDWNLMAKLRQYSKSQVENDRKHNDRIQQSSDFVTNPPRDSCEFSTPTGKQSAT